MEQQTEKEYHPVIFVAIWAGQLVSLLGSGLSEFALGVVLYEQSHSVIQFALFNLCLFLPQIIIGPVAGVIADRYSRRKIMVLSNVGGAVMTALMALVALTHFLPFWLIYLISLGFAICNATLSPPYAASIPMLVPKKHLGRANGMVQFATSTARVLSPLLAGVLVVTIQLPGIALIDGISFLVALGTLLPVRIPQPEPTGKTRQPIMKDALDGLRYITDRPSLVGLFLFFAFTNITVSYSGALFTPLVLSFTNSQALGLAVAFGGAGLLSGSILMTLWGGPKSRIHGVLGVGIFFGAAVALLGVHASVLTISIANFLLCACMPVINVSLVTILQTKVPPELQGRVFSSVRLIAWSTVPLAFLTVGVLSDTVFEPLLRSGGVLAGSIGQLIGVGPGRGMGLLLILAGLLPIISAIAGYASPRVRLVEQEIPDSTEESSLPGTTQAG